MSSDVKVLNIEDSLTLNGIDVETALNDKVDKVIGKQLSTNDYTTIEKNQLEIDHNIINHIAMSGLVSGGGITLTGGIGFDIAAGNGFVRNASNDIVPISWLGSSATVPNAGDNFVYIDYNGDVVFRTIKSDLDNIFIGYIATNDDNTAIVGFNSNTVLYGQYLSRLNKFIETTIGTLIEYGFELSVNSFPNTLKVTSSGGSLWNNFNEINIGQLTNFRKFYRDNLGVDYEDTSTPNFINNTQYNDISLSGTNSLVPMSTGYYKKDLFFITTRGLLYYQHGTSQYSEVEHAYSAEPPIVNPASTNVVVIAHIIIQEGNSVPIAIIDMRPTFNRLWDGHYFKDLIPTIEHRSIQGLLEDGHTQYHTDARGDARYYRKTELDGGSLDTRYYTELEINALLLGKTDTGHTHVSADITDLSATTVGLGNVPNIDATNASNISTGTLANARLSANLTQIGNLTKVNGDIISVVGGVYTARTIAQYKSDLALNNVANVNTTDASNISSGTLDNARLSINLTDIGNLNFTSGDFIQYDGSNLINVTINHIKTDLALTKSDVSLSNVANVDTTNASNISSGTLENARLSTNLNQIGNITFATNDFMQFNGAIVTNVTPAALKASLSLTKSDVSLGNVVNIDTTNASNISSGTLANNRLTTNLAQIGNITFATNDIVYYNGSILTKITPESYKTLLSITKSDVGLGNVADVDTTNASNISSGTLANARLTANLSQLGGITFVTNDFIQYNGSTLINVTPSAVKTSLLLTKGDVGLGNVANVDTTNASNITTGILPLSVIPAGALERLTIVSNQTARFALTTASVQNGDTVKQNDTGIMYYVIDDTNLDSNLGYEIYTAGAATSVPYSGITSLPTNISQLGNISFATNDIAYYNGSILTKITPESYKTLLSITKSDVGLGNVANSLQVINAGNGTSLASGNTASRPSAGTNGRLYASTDNGIFLDNGTTWVLQQAAISGDISISANSTTATLATVNSNVGTFNNVTVNAKGLVTAASNTAYLTGNQTITLSGDFSGSGTTSITGTLATVNSNIGTFNNVTVNAKGLVTSASNVSYLTGNQTITVTGDLTGSGTTGLALTLATVNSNVGTFNNVTVNAKGLVTSASNVSYLTGNQTITLSGDLTGSGTTGISGTLATVNSNVGTFGSTTVVPVITVNAKGLTTSVSTATLTNASVGLGNVANSLQVINSGGTVSYTTGLNASKPAAGTAGRFYNAIDQGINYYDNGTTWGAQLPAYTGDVTSLLGGTALTLATVNSNIGTFNNVTVNAKGLVTAASNVAYLTGNQTITVTGDITGSGTTAIGLTLATVNSNVGTFGSTTVVPVITVNAKGLTTAISTVALTNASVGLGNVSNNLQVINAGNGTSFSSGTLAARPSSATNGRLYATTNDGIYLDNGTTWVLQSPAYTGDVTKASNATALTLATVNSNIGTFNNITINAKGLATAGSNVNYLTGNQTITLSGDITGSGTTGITGTLATVNSNVGTFNNVTINAKGLATAGSNANYLQDPSANGIVVRTSLNTTINRLINGTTNQISITNGDGVSANPTVSIANDPIIPGTGAITIPIGTTAQRPVISNGQFRFNSDTLIEEIAESGVWRPVGRLLKFVTGNITQTTGTTIIPYDNTLPTSTEGFQIWTASITPSYANSTIIIMYNIFYECSAINVVVTTTLLNNTAAIAASSSRQATPNQPDTVNVTKAFTSGTTSTITLSARIGPAAASTVYVNRGNTETFGGTIATSYIIMEVY